MANREACELYIEQQIKEGLEEGKTPYSIGKDLSAWVEKVFETSIPAETIRSRARYIKERGGETTTPPPTTDNHSQIPDNQVAEVKHGGKREGAGPPKKYEFTNAIHIAIFVISHLERIAFDDPKREEALQKVRDWIEHNL